MLTRTRQSHFKWLRLHRNGQTGSCRTLRRYDGSRHNRDRLRFLQTPSQGTADSEYWHCLGVRSLLLQGFRARMNKSGYADHFQRLHCLRQLFAGSRIRNARMMPETIREEPPMETPQTRFRVNGIVIPLLLVLGIMTVILGIASLSIGKFRGEAGLLIFGGLGGTAIALLLEKLTEIANHLAVIRTQLNALEVLSEVADHLGAIRTQMGKGVLGLLG